MLWLLAPLPLFPMAGLENRSPLTECTGSVWILRYGFEGEGLKDCVGKKPMGCSGETRALKNGFGLCSWLLSDLVSFLPSGGL